jgi:hypothetical protein
MMKPFPPDILAELVAVVLAAPHTRVARSVTPFVVMNSG